MAFPAPAARRLVALALLGPVAVPFPAGAATIYVDCRTGNDVSGTGTSANPYKTIQKGVDSAVAGDTVQIKAGVCDETNQPSFPVYVAPGVSVVGAGRTQTFVRNQGVVAGQSAFYFAETGASFPPTQLLADMDIATDSDGIILYNGSPTIRNNVIHGGGTGVYIFTLYTGEAASPTIEDNSFVEMGSGVEVQASSGPSDPILRRNWMLGSAIPDFAQYGVYVGDLGIAPGVRIENNVIANSRIGIGVRGGSPTIVNNTISATESGIYLDSAPSTPTSVAAIDNNILAYNVFGVQEDGTADTAVASIENNDFFVNSAEDYFDWLLGPVVDPNAIPNAAGNLTVNPQFTDPTRNDYHIHPSSSLRDAGVVAGAPTDDIDRQGRTDGAPDVGADETSNIGLPNLRVTSHRLMADLCPGSEPPGNNANIDPGEIVDLRWEVTNLAAFARATNVTATITGPAGTTPSVHNVSFGKIDPLKSALSSTLSLRWEPSGLDCRSKMEFRFVLSSSETGPLPAQTYEIRRASCDPCDNPQKPAPAIDATLLEDDCPNGVPPGLNGSIDPGETGRLSFNVENTSVTARASVVQVYVSTTNPAVTPSSGVVEVGNIPPGSVRSSLTPFEFQVDPALISCGGSIVFDVQLDWLELAPAPRPSQGVTFNVPNPCVNCAAVRPAFALGNRTFTDTCTTRASNGLIEPGERIDLVLAVQNTSAQAGATAVRGTLYALSPLVTPSSAAVNFGTVGPSQTVAAPAVPLRIDRTAPCGTNLSFELEVESEQTGPVSPRLPFTLQVAPACQVCSDVPPTLSLAGPSINDICLAAQPPGGNGQVDPGETIELTINVLNSSNVAQANNVVANLTIAQPWVSPQAGSVLVGTVPPLQSRPATFPFTFAVERGTSLCGQFIDVGVELDSDETGPVAQTPIRLLVDPACNICPVPQPVLSVAGTAFTDRCPFGDPPGGNGSVDPGEIIDLVLAVENASTFAPASGVSAVFSTSHPAVTPSGGSVAGPDIAPGATGTLDPFTFQIDYSRIGCGGTIPFDVRLSSAETGPLALQTVNVVVASPCQACREVVAGLLLYRASIPSVVTGWATTAGLPLASTSAGKDPAPWPKAATAPGSQDDLGVIGSGTAPLILWRLLDGADANQGNSLRVVKKSGSPDVTVHY